MPRTFPLPRATPNAVSSAPGLQHAKLPIDFAPMKAAQTENLLGRREEAFSIDTNFTHTPTGCWFNT